MSSDESNIQRLQSEGFVIKTPMPQQYEDVIEGLSDDEISLLIGIKNRLEDAAGSGTEPEVAHYSAYLLYPPF